MRRPMKFSVVIPTCDRPDLLRHALDSVLAQSFAPIEITVVDNGLTPVDRLSLPDASFLKVVRALPRFGVSQARNLGAILSSGQYVAFLDDDDAWDAGYLAGIRRRLDQDQLSVVLGRGRHMSSGLPKSGKQGSYSTPQEWINEILIRNPGASGSNTVVARSVFASSRGYDPFLTTGQDKALVLDLLLKGASVARAEAWVDYRDDRSISRQTEAAKLIEGKTRFLSKYWSIMTFGQKLRNVRTIGRMRIDLLTRR